MITLQAGNFFFTINETCKPVLGTMLNDTPVMTFTSLELQMTKYLKLNRSGGYFGIPYMCQLTLYGWDYRWNNLNLYSSVAISANISAAIQPSPKI